MPPVIVGPYCSHPNELCEGCAFDGVSCPLLRRMFIVEHGTLDSVTYPPAPKLGSKPDSAAL